VTETLQELVGRFPLAVDPEWVRRQVEVWPGIGTVDVRLEMPGTVWVTATAVSPRASVPRGVRWQAVAEDGSLAGSLVQPIGPILEEFPIDPVELRRGLDVAHRLERGTGGQVDAVADRLALLAESRQVLCVTHQARIAARAHVHMRVDKAVREGRTASQVVPLDHDGRLLEIERLLAGRAPGPRAEALAAELLDRYAPCAPEPPRPAAGGARKRKPRLRAGSRSAPKA